MTKNSTTTATNYARNFIYKGNVLQFFNHPEGYVEPDGSGGYDYIYQYKDHLGNIRLSYKNTGTLSSPVLQIQEENNYYPFGLKHKGYNGNINGVDHKYGFGGKEEQDDDVGGNKLDWLDFSTRNYDAALGRWMNLDPLAEMMRRHSPYNYAFDNPIFFIDPDGMKPRPWGYAARAIEEENGEEEEGECCKDLVGKLFSYFSGLGKEVDNLTNGTGQTDYSDEEIKERDKKRLSESVNEVALAINEAPKKVVDAVTPDALELNVQGSIPLATPTFPLPQSFTIGFSLYIDSYGNVGSNFNSGYALDTGGPLPSIGGDFSILYSKNPSGTLKLFQFKGLETNFDLSIPTPYGFSATGGYIDAADYWGLSLGGETYSIAPSISINKTKATQPN